MKKVPLSAVKDDLSRYLHAAEDEDVVITRHGRPAGILIGFRSEDDWFDYRLEHDPRFLDRIDRARRELRAGNGIAIESLKRGPRPNRRRPRVRARKVGKRRAGSP